MRSGNCNLIVQTFNYIAYIKGTPGPFVISWGWKDIGLKTLENMIKQSKTYSWLGSESIKLLKNKMDDAILSEQVLIPDCIQLSLSISAESLVDKISLRD